MIKFAKNLCLSEKGPQPLKKAFAGHVKRAHRKTSRTLANTPEHDFLIGATAKPRPCFKGLPAPPRPPAPVHGRPQG